MADDFILESEAGTAVIIESAPDETFILEGAAEQTVIIEGGERGPQGPAGVAGPGNVPTVVTVTEAAAPAINLALGNVFTITGLAHNITSMTTNLTGSIADGQKIEIRITDDGTPRSITWGASFQDTTIAQPIITVSGKMLRTGWEWNATASKFDCIAVA